MAWQSGINFHEPLFNNEELCQRGDFIISCKQLVFEHGILGWKRRDVEVFKEHEALLVCKVFVKVEFYVIATKELFALGVEIIGVLDKLDDPIPAGGLSLHCVSESIGTMQGDAVEEVFK